MPHNLNKHREIVSNRGALYIFCPGNGCQSSSELFLT